MKLKLYAGALLVVVALCGGFYLKHLLNIKQQYETQKNEIQQIKEQLNINKESASKLEQNIKKVKQYEQSDRKEFTQKNNRKIPDNSCGDPDFIELFNKQNRQYERLLSGEYDATLSNNITDINK